MDPPEPADGGRGAACHGGDLRALIRALPVPTAPPSFPQKEAALGLALMDLSLRLDHVPRLSEHLTLVDRGHMARSVSVDVDLDAISGVQRDSLLVPADATVSVPGRGGSLWVPVSRYSRRDLAPVIVKDSTGEVVPRLTHRDSNHVTAAALVRLLSMLLDAHRDVTVADTVVYKLRNTHQRSRWLIEAAIAELVTVGSATGERLRTPVDLTRLPQRPTTAPNGRRAVDSREVRDLALAGLDALFPEDDRTGLESAQRGDANLVTNFVFAISPIMRCYWPQSSRRTGASKTGRVPYPLWVRWELPHRLIRTPRLLANADAGVSA